LSRVVISKPLAAMSCCATGESAAVVPRGGRRAGVVIAAALASAPHVEPPRCPRSSR